MKLAERAKENALKMAFEFRANGLVIHTSDVYPYGTEGVWVLSKDRKKLHISMNDFIMIRDFDILSFKETTMKVFHDNSNFSEDTYGFAKQ